MPSASIQHKISSRLWPVILLLAGLSFALGFRLWAQNKVRQSRLEHAQLALEAKRYAEAEMSACAALADSPDLAEALLIAAEALVGQNKREEALTLLDRVPRGENEYFLAAQAAAGQILIDLGRASDAEARFRHVLEINPEQPFALNRLVFLMALEGRRWESLPYLHQLLRIDHFTVEDLLFTGNVEALVEYKDLKVFLEAAPDDPGPLLGAALLALRRNQLEDAERLLRAVTAANPEIIQAHASLGMLILEQNSPEKMAKWAATLPQAALAHPETWVAQGLWAQRQQQTHAALRCFWEAIRRDPNQYTAHYQLSLALATLGQDELAQHFSQRAAILKELTAALQGVFDDRKSLEDLRRCAELTESIGRLWEAWGWYRAVLVETPGDATAQHGRQRVEEQLRPDLELMLPESNLASQVAFSSYPLPVFERRASVLTTPMPRHANVSFRDIAYASGAQFTYFNADDPLTEGRRMFEFTGGGAGAIDYDLDGWSDLYFTQGCVWPPESNQQMYLDRLYRNRAGDQFTDVTEDARLGDERFSQGLAVGDFNRDAFPDLFVANVGENRLYRNNGDGTFDDVSRAAAIGGDRWTTSCLIADLNADGLADLYEVNYVEGDSVYGHICNRGGKARVCSPVEFDAQHDRLFFNLGDGRFQDVSESGGILVPEGKGLGIVAADFEGTGQLGLFVANDMTPNFYFANRVTAGGPPEFVERAMVTGLAYDRDGRVQACMGIAADDADHDGLLDLFVTNFYKEHNTLYQQQLPGFFADISRETGLKEPSYKMLGFGTQFLDGELDGYPDLVVANGHIDDFTHEDIPYKMRPQYFRNNGDDRFTELKGPGMGEYFEGDYLGRGLARADWNRDGREDFVVSHLGAPIALLINTTDEVGNYIRIGLRGSASDRDAIGTTVVAKYAGKTRMRQLTAGDGYQASNERVLVFGLGEAEQVDELSIRWPSGLEETFTDLPVNQELLILEGKPSPVPFHVAPEFVKSGQ